MKKVPSFPAKAFMLLFMLTGCIHLSFAQQKKIRVLIVTGGHGFEHKPFYNVFDSIPSITYDTLVQPQANALIASPGVSKYDVLVFYDLFDSISPAQQEAYISLLKKGASMIFLHHSLVSYQNWPEFIKIVGGQYHTSPVLVNGDTLRANYEHGVNIPVKVEQKDHPVTRGISDFEIEDEVYGDVEILPQVKPLLSTTHPKSMRYLAWINHYEHSNVICIQLGHGPSAYSNPNFRKLIRQAIEWSATLSPTIKKNVPLDSIVLSDPFILADQATHMYYLTGTGGLLWKSKDLALWDGPYQVAKTDPASWMGPKPMIWAAEIHPYKGKYYYFATFTNRAVSIDTVEGRVIERRACHVLVSDKPDGPYVPMQDPIYLPANKPTLDATLWIDTDGKPYMIYCYEWLQNLDGTIEKIALKPDLSGTTGAGKVLFRASDCPWSREKDQHGRDRPNKVTDGPYLFRTATGRLGMIWTSWIYDVYTQGVAYSNSGTLDGPWTQETAPVTPPNYGHGMIFRALDGKLLMSIHSHKNINGHTRRVPHLFEVDLSGDRLVVGKPYIPG
jgi:type 1 glutamine amidotransferase